jgi:hypothetical protein
MASTSQINDVTGAAPGTPTDLDAGTSTPPTHARDFMNKDKSGTAVTADAIARQDARSYYFYLQLHLTGTFTSATNVKAYLADKDLSKMGTSPTPKITGSVVAYAAYVQAASTADTGDSNMPETAAGALDISNAGLAAGTPGYSEMVRMQITVGADATPGTYTALGTFTVFWTET